MDSTNSSVSLKTACKEMFKPHNELATSFNEKKYKK